MTDLTPAQQKIRDELDGMFVVDAGPGTGKTHTIVERYVKLISRDDVSPKDVLLLTFTNNAAAEMDERIKKRMTELGLEKDSKLVQTKTFDAFCLSIIMDSPDQVSDFFGFEERLTRSATIQQNETLNQDYFTQFMDDFLNRKGEDYGDVAIIASEYPESIMKLIEKLMSRGLIPLKKGWFGSNWERDLLGDTDLILANLKEGNAVNKNNNCANASVIKEIDEDDGFMLPVKTADGSLPVKSLEEAAAEDRTLLFSFIHDIYFDYIRKSISDNRLTFGLNAMLAFTVLYGKHSVRERNSYRYLMVDEFQDTNANQMMISLMILSEPNLCVVGDWKQGIYGFRFVTIENIIDFERKAVEMRRFLNDDYTRIRYRIPEISKLPLDVNFRSSQQIIDKAFECICMPATSDEAKNNKPD